MKRKKGDEIDRRTFLKEMGIGAAAFAHAPAHAQALARSSREPLPLPPSVSARKDRVVYRGEHLRAVSMPLGGIGTGVIALAGDGGLRHWQVVHNADHLAHVPDSFFALCVKPESGPPVARILQSAQNYGEPNFKLPVTSTDYVVPSESRKLLETLPGVKELEFSGEYPLAEIRYIDESFGPQVRLEAYAPFEPLNAKDSGLPCIVFEFHLKNPGPRAVTASVMATLQNFVGWDGHSPITGVEYFAYHSNRNTLERAPGITAINMSNPRLPDDFPFQGQLALAALSDDASYQTQWDNLESLWSDFAEDGQLDRSEGAQESAPGRTWNGALAVPLALEPGEEKTATFILAWYFPNRYINWGQPFMVGQYKKSKFWIGTMYSNWFKNAMDVVNYARSNLDRLRGQTRLWRDTFYDSTLPYVMLDAISSQASIIRSPTCLWVQDGNFFGFEGCCGASTGGFCEGGGCCPLNCTHVWGYEQSLSRLFPELERAMRSTDWERQQAPEGYVLTRTDLPLYLPRPWETSVPTPPKVALDGMISTVLKTYREHRQGAPRERLVKFWPHVRKCLDYTIRTFDANEDGLIESEQFNTYDISVYGVNSFIGAYYLAALRAAEEMGRVASDEAAAQRYRAVYDKGSANLSRELWNGEYFIQKVDMEKHPKYEYGNGCFSDQLLGQWWAHQLGLGYLLPEDQVKSAVGAIFKHNWRENFIGFKQSPRVFVSEHDQGLLVCTWPRGGRPAVPTLYSDEVWTGIEYEIAGLLLHEGMSGDALKLLRGVRARYDGRERSPWNDVECGDHYTRAMSSWAMLEAASGQQYNAAEGYLSFAPRITPEDFRSFFITAAGWGTFEQKTSSTSQVNSLIVRSGKVDLRTLSLQVLQGAANAFATLNGEPLHFQPLFANGALRLISDTGLTINTGNALQVRIS